ncbi:E3 ubiquitin-protein ligase TRIM71-like [Mytilus californianus]|uniref:E3 ubiquitin-protein ligase TRIM71-like n=1 Tax=Mytilus californianus TaxID=6549 RepID=UPI002247FDCA|nr:E3 ubiquitin-protein ligase TRIM71-like [Mytilus californianus]
MTSGSRYCDPCNQRSSIKLARVWCTECQEALCKECEAYHQTFKVSRDHRLIPVVENDQFPTSLVKIKAFCERHALKRNEFYCTLHEEPMCAICVANEHKNCDAIVTIEKAAENAKFSPALADLEDRMYYVVNLLEKLKQDRVLNIQVLDKQKTHMLLEIKRFRENITRHLDMLEKELNTEVTEMHQKHVEDLQLQAQELDNRIHTIRDYQQSSKKIKNQATNVHLLLAMRELENLQLSQEEYLETISDRLSRVDINLEFNQNAVEIPTLAKPLGFIQTKISPCYVFTTTERVKHAPLYVKGILHETRTEIKHDFIVPRSDRNAAITGGVFLSDGRIVLADNNNKRLLIYNENGTVFVEVKLNGKPWDVTEVGLNKAALTLPSDRMVQFFDIKTMRVTQETNVKGRIYGLSSYGGRTVVVCRGSGMLILDEEGQVDTALPIDVTFVEYVCVGPGRIYYTDWYRKSVHCIDMTGEEIFRLKYNKMKYPLGITLNRDGTVFVVGRDSHNVLHVSADGHQREVILGKQHDLTYPRVISSHHGSRRMFVTYSNKHVVVFTLT